MQLSFQLGKEHGMEKSDYADTWIENLFIIYNSFAIAFHYKCIHANLIHKIRLIPQSMNFSNLRLFMKKITETTLLSGWPDRVSNEIFFFMKKVEKNIYKKPFPLLWKDNVNKHLAFFCCCFFYNEKVMG